ncbi:MAG: hypothetical protein AMXMBFR83_11840 [Phycisphaerae bacterium]
MNVIVTGAGLVGFHIAERLSQEGHDVTVIERNRDKGALLQSRLNASVIHGSGASAEILEAAGVERADRFIAVTDQDEVNLVATRACASPPPNRVLRAAGTLRKPEGTWPYSITKPCSRAVWR